MSKLWSWLIFDNSPATGVSLGLASSAIVELLLQRAFYRNFGKGFYKKGNIDVGENAVDKLLIERTKR